VNFTALPAEIDQDLLQVPPIRLDEARRPQRGMDCEPHRLGVRLHRQDGPHVSQHRMEVKLDRRGLDTALLDAAEVEDLVDEGEQRAPGGSDGPRHVLLLGVERRAAHEIAQADDGVERRAELVADTGQEPALGPARLLGLLPCGRQLADQRGGVEWQHDQSAQQPAGEVQVGAPVFRRGDHDRKPDDANGGRKKKVLEAEAEAVAEDHPKVDRVEQRRALVADIDPVGEHAGVHADRQHAAHHGHARSSQHVGGQRNRNRQEDDSSRQRLPDVGPPGPRDDQIAGDQNTDHEPVDRHLMFSIGPIAQTIGQSGDERQVKTGAPQRVGAAIGGASRVGGAHAVRASCGSPRTNAMSSLAGIGLAK
jgi:hypothetical protein